ncbi:MAG TPA: 4-alpha-glucanotransferase [Euzebyales bacterium]|nr:4-alpha-glucanotransferase [Euzebyales bacterium]
MAPPDPEQRALRRLARAAGVADAYEASGAAQRPPDSTLRAVLTTLGHDCDDKAAIARSLRALRRRGWTCPVEPVAVVWRGGDVGEPSRPTVTVSAPVDVEPDLTLTLEDGTERSVGAPVWGGVAETGSGRRRRGTVELPADLPLGYHRLMVATAGDEDACTVIVAPDRAPAITVGRRWGWMLQAYAVRSAAGWGQGEFADLALLAEWAGGDGADLLLINPVHAAAPVLPREASPYSPTSRRFADPCYLRVTDVAGYDALDATTRRRWEDLPAPLAADAERIDRDAVWQAKREALWLLYERRADDQRRELAAFRADGGPALQRFATFCALAEELGIPFTTWPDPLRDPRSDAVAAWAGEHDGVVGFHAWLQLLCARQLRDAQDRATAAGMDIGIVHDLAVGVAPGGADVWSLPDEFARSMRVGAPPDAFNHQGQDWGQPPPLPGAMRAAGYRTQREVLSASLAVGGGLRIDHILGFSRLFWIPEDTGPVEGTYVGYPADELFAVLVLEAHRAGAIVIGEDLGTVDDRIRGLLRRRGVAGSAVLWFEGDDTTTHGRRDAARYPRSALASVTTHDLPTATGWWDGSALRVRHELGLLSEPLADAQRRLADDKASMLALFRAHDVLADDATDVRARVVAMHRFLASTPSALVAAALWDGVGDPRQPNVPGTVDQYPNWRLPLATPGPDGPVPLTLEALTQGTAVDDVVAAIRAARG